MSAPYLYRMYDNARNLLYIGVSQRIFHRADEHLREKVWFSEVATFAFEKCDSADIAYEREREAIRSENPRYNRIRYASAPPVIHNPMPAVDKDLFTVAEAAQQIDIHPGAVREAITRGRIEAIRVGGGEKCAGLLLIHRDEINRYIRDIRGTHGPKPTKKSAE